MNKITSNIKLTIVIPTLNEADHLKKLLDDILLQVEIDSEIIVSDGGSTDETLNVAKRYNCKIINSLPGRGRQLNAGIRESQNDLILVLHCDSRILDSKCLKNSTTYFYNQKEYLKLAGHFSLNFQRKNLDLNKMAYRYVENKTFFNRVNTTNGDQGLLITKKFFNDLGGFWEVLPYLEDQDFAEKVRRNGKWITLPYTILTSARRFEEEGFHKRYILMSIMMGLHSTGVDYFFKNAPGVYRVQKETGELMLWPFFKLIIKMCIFHLGFLKSLVAWWKVGRYVRQNSWQLFYFFDILIGLSNNSKKYLFLTFHDKIFFKITDNFICDTITSILSFIWFMLVLAPYFCISESIKTAKIILIKKV